MVKDTSLEGEETDATWPKASEACRKSSSVTSRDSRWLRDLEDLWLGDGPACSLMPNVRLSHGGVAGFAAL